jgi:hypothetical protein
MLGSSRHLRRDRGFRRYRELYQCQEDCHTLVSLLRTLLQEYVWGSVVERGEQVRQVKFGGSNASKWKSRPTHLVCALHAGGQFLWDSHGIGGQTNHEVYHYSIVSLVLICFCVLNALPASPSTPRTHSLTSPLQCACMVHTIVVRNVLGSKSRNCQSIYTYTRVLYDCTRNVRPLAVLRSFSSASGLALRRTSSC